MTTSSGQCTICGQEASLVCVRCRLFYYCDKKHQKKDWKQHKKICLPSTEQGHVQALVCDLQQSCSLHRFAEIVNEICLWCDPQAAPGQFNDQKRNAFANANGVPALIQAMEMHGTNLSTVENNHALMSLLHTGAVNETTLLSTVEAGGIRAIVRGMNADYEDVCHRFGSQNAVCVEFSNWLLTYPGSSVIRKGMIEDGGINAIIELLQYRLDRDSRISKESFVYYRKAKYNGCSVLYNFASHNISYKTAVVKAGGLRAVAVVVEEWSRIPEMKLKCKELLELIYCRCEACMEGQFCNLCCSKAYFGCPCGRVRYCNKKCQRKDRKAHEKLCIEITKDGLRGSHLVDHAQDEYELLMSAETDVSGDPEVSVATVVDNLKCASSVDDVLHGLLVLSRARKEEIIDCNGFSTVVAVMDKYEDVVEVQKRACAVFAVFQQGVPEECTVMSINQSGGKAAILRAMANHPQDASLQGNACSALIIQAAVKRMDDGRIDTSLLEVIVQAMNRHSDDYSVQKEGIGVLWNLSSGSPENKTAVVETHGFDAVSAAAEKFWDTSMELDTRASGFFTSIFASETDDSTNSPARGQDVFDRLETGTR
jgi:hypothetical protein